MCGIYGEVGVLSAELWRRTWESASHALVHRGPDGSGEYVDEFCGIGHRRLKIVDLHDTSAQPMRSTSGRYVLSFNGEIYNFAELRTTLSSPVGGWRSTGDTEILLELLAQRGVSGLKSVVGMFAFALWDRDERTLLIARDRLGKKPVFLARTTTGNVRFASEIAALLVDNAVPRNTTPSLIAEYLQYGYVSAPRTAFTTISSVPPGCFTVIRVSDDAVDIGALERYWELSAHTAPTVDRRRWQEEFSETLADAVKIRTRSDVAIGSFLSGGVDSSVVSLLANDAMKGQLRTFTLTFDEARFSEAPFADEVSRAIHSRHEELRLRQFNLEDIQYVSRTGELIGDVSFLGALQVARAAKNHVTVALTGNGGDELLGGYDRYFRAMALAKTLVPRWLEDAARFGVLKFPGWLGGDTRLALITRDVASAYANIVRHYPGRARILGVPSNIFVDPVASALRKYEDLPELFRLMATDVATYIPGDTMTVLDRTSMLSSVELRSPLLDHRLFEMLATADPAWVSQEHDRKKPLRELFSDRLPRAVFQRKKMGFSVPANPWMTPQFQRVVASLLAERRERMAELVDIRDVSRVVKGFRYGTHRNVGRLWHLLILSEWLERWRPTVIANA